MIKPPENQINGTRTKIKLQHQKVRNLLNNHFTNVIIQKVIKTKFINNYRAYVRIKNKMMKMQHNSLYTLTKGWFGDSI